MAVTFKNYDSAAGVTYRCITDTQADWGAVPVGTYFFDLDTILPYYRDLQGYVIAVFETGQPGNVTNFANVDKQLISGGALWNSGMTFDVSNLTYSFDGTIQTTNGSSTVTLSVGDTSFDRIDAIVVDDNTPYGVVSVIEGQPASNPGTPEIPFDKLLVQLIIVATGATSIAVNQDIIYDENIEWTGSVVNAPGGSGTLNFASTTPTPQQGTICLRVTGNNRRRWARFTRTSPVTSSDYTSISGYFYAEEYAPKRRLYIRFRSGTSYVGNGVYVTNTFASTSTPGIWQQFTVPLYLFNLPGAIDGVDIQYMSSVNTTINNWALDFVRLQGGFNPAQISSNNANIYNSNGSLTANRTVDQGSFDLLFRGDQNSKIDHNIISTLNPNDSSSSRMQLDSTSFLHNDDTNGFQGNLYLTPGNSYMSVTNSATAAAGQVSFNADGSSLSQYDGISTTREIRVDVDGVSINQLYKFPNADGLTGQVMTTNGAGQLSFSTPSGGGGVGGTGTANYVPRWTNSTTLSSTSRIWDNGTFVGIGATSQSESETLRITGTTRLDDAFGSYFKLQTGDITYENTSASSNFNVLSSGAGVSVARVNIIGATSGHGRISYGKTGNTQKLDIFNNLTSAAVITLTSSDNVGIGTASPSGKAHIVAASNNASVLVLDGLNDDTLFGKNISITKQADVQTTGASTAIAATIALAQGERIVCQGRFIAQEVTPSTVTIGGNFMFVAENIGGAITIIGNDVSLKENSAGTPTVSFDGVLSTVRIKPTGGGETMSWLFTYTYEIISQPVL